MPFEAEAAYGWAKMCEGWAQAATTTRTKIFFDGLSNWKQNAAILKALGKEVPPPPSVPELVSCDVELAKQRYADSLATGEPIVQDYFSYTPLPIDPKELTLEGPGEKAPVIADPVSFEDRPGWFLVTAGFKGVNGQVINHPVHGKLKFWSYPGFGGVITVRWQAIK